MHVICSCQAVWWMLQARVIHHSLWDSSPCCMYWSNGAVLVWSIICSFPQGGFISSIRLQQELHDRFKRNTLFISHRNSVLVARCLPTLVMTLRCCQHKSPRGLCGEDVAGERRSCNLWPLSMDSVWLLFTPVLSCVDTKWLRYSDRQWEKRERGGTLSGQHRNSATQSDNTENTFTSDKLPHPWPPTISSPPLPYSLWKQSESDKFGSACLCVGMSAEGNSGSGREEKVSLSGQIRV